MIPVGKKGEISQEEIDQERRPNLPAHDIGAGAQEVGQLEGLFDLFEEDFDLPAAAVEIHNARRAPLQVVAQKNHLYFPPVHWMSGKRQKLRTVVSSFVWILLFKALI